MDSSYGSESSSTPKESVDQENQESMEHTVVVPNKLLSPDGEPLKAGDEIVVQVVKNYGDESEIKYAPHKKGEEEEETTETPESDVANDMMALDKEGA